MRKGGEVGVIDRSIMARSTDELKRLIAEYPDYHIVVLAGEEANSGDYGWMYCNDISFGVGEILETDFYDYNDAPFTDRDLLEEYIEEMLCDEYHSKPEAEYELAIKAKMDELEPYWTNVIVIWATN